MKVLWIIPAILLLLVLFGVVYSVNETEQVIIVRMGKPVREVTDAGLNWKLPWPIEDVRFFDKRLLEYDAAPKEIITKDKKTLVVDNFARWRIVAPRRFLTTLRSENAAQSRIDDIIYSVLRVELGRHDLLETVATHRQSLMDLVTEQSNKQLSEFGLEVVDVRIKRADLPPENEKAIFERMRAERSREAKQYRSEGEEAALKIRAETDKQAAVIMAEALQKTEQIKGEGDAKALRIYAQAYQQDPRFYELYRTLQAYEKTIDRNTVIVLSPDTEFFKYLQKGSRR